MRGRALLGVVAVTVLGCGSAPAAAPVAPPTDVDTTRAPPAPVAAESAPDPEPPAPATLAMYPVARIYSLLDVIATDGELELRLGVDDGGGTLGRFRYVPLVGGAPDFERETDIVGHADTTGFGYVAIEGKRPHLFMHWVSGFRSAAGEGYRILADDQTWRLATLGHAPGIGLGIVPWTKDRLLELRGPQPEVALSGSEETRLPEFRVVRGADKVAPSLPKALRTRLTDEGFFVATFTVLRAGEVLAIGRRRHAGGIGTVLWTGDPKEPAYFTTGAQELPEESELGILGGTTLANVRLQVAERVMRLEGSSWIEESTVPKGGLPDVWFGSTLVLETESGLFARTAEKAPWLPVPVTDPDASRRSHAVDAQGTIWRTEDDLLLSSWKPPVQRDVTEEALVASRKASILREGSQDVTGEPPQSYGTTKCRMHYVLLDRSAAASAPQDFPKIRAALKGHSEFAKAKFIVSRERGWQFFGAQLEKSDDAERLAALVSKRVKGSEVLCAEPVADRELRIDLASGALLP